MPVYIGYLHYFPHHIIIISFFFHIFVITLDIPLSFHSSLIVFTYILFCLLRHAFFIIIICLRLFDVHGLYMRSFSSFRHLPHCLHIFFIRYYFHCVWDYMMSLFIHITLISFSHFLHLLLFCLSFPPHLRFAIIPLPHTAQLASYGLPYFSSAFLPSLHCYCLLSFLRFLWIFPFFSFICCLRALSSYILPPHASLPLSFQSSLLARSYCLHACLIFWRSPLFLLHVFVCLSLCLFSPHTGLPPLRFMPCWAWSSHFVRAISSFHCPLFLHSPLLRRFSIFSHFVC